MMPCIFFTFVTRLLAKLKSGHRGHLHVYLKLDPEPGPRTRNSRLVVRQDAPSVTINHRAIA